MRVLNNLVIASTENDTVTFKLVEGDCDRCDLLLFFTLRMIGKEVSASRLLGSLRSGGRDSTIMWKPGGKRYVLVFREGDLWELEEGIYGVPTKGVIPETQEGKFSIEGRVVVEISRFGQWTRRYETPVYSVPFQS